jgi:hypothetical protein
MEVRKTKELTMTIMNVYQINKTLKEHYKDFLKR